MNEGVYTCAFCGESIVVPVDVSAGDRQEYVEDCPVCCQPNLLTVELGSDGRVAVTAAAGYR